MLRLACRVPAGCRIDLLIAVSLIQLHKSDLLFRRMSAAVAESPVTTATSAFVSNTHLRVLLVESKATTRKVLLHMLERFGLDATVADAFGPAYTAAIGAQERRHPFDLLIVDAFLPDLGALTLVNKLRNRGINPPVRCSDKQRA